MVRKAGSVCSVVLLLLALVVLSGCSQKPQDAIIGTWQSVRGDLITFTEDGDIYENNRFSSKYWFEDDDTLSFGGLIGNRRFPLRTFHIQFQGDTMTLTSATDDHRLFLTKVRD